MTRATYLRRMKTDYPHHVVVKDYIARVRAKDIPRPDKFPMPTASWYDVKKGSNSRVFGFLTEVEARAFKAEYKVN